MTGSTRRRGLLYHWVVLLLCLINLLAFTLLTPYDSVGPQLLENADFSQGLQGWKLEGDARSLHIEDGLLRIDHLSNAGMTILTQCHPAKEMPAYLLLSGQGMSSGVVRGDKPWHEACIDLLGYDERGKADFSVKIRLFGMDGDQAWVEAARVYRNAVGYQQICVQISLFQAAGSFQIRALSLHQALTNATYQTISLILLVGWGVLSLWIVRALYEYYREKPQASYLLIVFVLLLTGILLPQEARSSLEEHILSLLSHLEIFIAPTDTLQQHGSFDLWPQQWDLSKISHMLGFALLSGILFTERKVAPVGRLFGLLLLAVATELLQFYVPDRTPRLSDVIVDGLGVLMGWGLGALFRVLIPSPLR